MRQRKDEFYLANNEFWITLRYPDGDIKWLVEYMVLEKREYEVRIEWEDEVIFHLVEVCVSGIVQWINIFWGSSMWMPL